MTLENKIRRYIIMNKINWKVRFKHKNFIIALFALLALLSQQILMLFGIEISKEFSAQLVGIFNTVLAILVLLGVVVDHTTDGIEDSKQALGYRKPKSDSDYI